MRKARDIQYPQISLFCIRRKRKKNRVKIILLLLPFVAAFSCAIHSRTTEYGQQTVKNVDLERYMGRWYEIASFPNWFQRDCYCTMAEYELQGDHVSVRNSCRKGSSHGKLEVATGKAYPVPDSNNSRLKVQFFWPFKGDYWIIALDDNYQYAMVGHPSKKYLWILSRTQEMPDSAYQGFIENAAQKGYDISKIKRTPGNDDR
jgi:apolipoprotein D and lipocalin family protein